MGSRLSNSIGAMPAFALTWNPVPGVENTAPRGLLTLKKLAGRLVRCGGGVRHPVPVDLATGAGAVAEQAVGPRDRPAAQGGAIGVTDRRDRGHIRAGAGENHERESR